VADCNLEPVLIHLAPPLIPFAKRFHIPAPLLVRSPRYDVCLSWMSSIGDEPSSGAG